MKIIVYSKTGCPWSKEVKDFLSTHNIQFEERDMLKNPVYKEEAIKKSNQWKSPTVDIDGHILADSDVEQVEKYLRGMGIIN